MGGKREKAGRHKRDCACEKCQKKQGSRPTDANLARKLKAKIKAEERWLRILETEIHLMEIEGDTGPLKKTLMYLDDRDLGKPVDTVNHLHDKPLEVNATLSLGEGMRLAMEKADQRVRSRK
jgi:hypothetical protein